MSNATHPSPVTPLDDTRHRSGAVARMLRMPVATLRVWERRYAVTAPALSPSGQRLYSAHDVQRLTLIKQLTEQGHAIGRLALLDMAQLQRVAATHAGALSAAMHAARAGAEAAPLPTQRAWRLVVIGQALGARLGNAALLRRLGRPVELLGPFDNAAKAAAACGTAGADAVVMHAPTLHADLLAAFDAAAPGLAAAPKAVFYGFGTLAVCDALAAAGVALLREPQPDAVLAQWISRLPAPARPVDDAHAATPAPVPPRRWDDAALADFAGRSSTIACECPRHVAELLVQLSQFEAYSAECEDRSAADAALHARLRQVAASCRAQFEAALEQVALHEGLLLPGSAPRGPDAA